MFNLNALLKFINVNNDGYIQKSEIQQFLGTQKSPSIFNGYLNSISNDVDNNTFINDMLNIMQKAKAENNQTPELDFADENVANQYQQLNERQGKEDIAQIKQEALRRYGVKVENMEEFENLFNQFIKEAQENGDSYYLIFQKFDELGYTKPITMDMVKASANAGAYTIDLPNDMVFENMDWSNSKEVFNYLSFNDKTFSQTSKQNLPDGYVPQDVFDKGKTIGLGIDDVHDMGYTGKGVSVAICDWQLRPHNDLNIKEYQCADYASKVKEYFHASAVTGIVAGKQTGVAPDSDVYFFAAYQDPSENGGTDMFNTLQSIINKNKELPDDKK